jgi:DNA ligase-1
MPTVKELKDKAKALGYTGYSKMKKAELVELLKPKLKVKKEKTKIQTMALPTLYKLTKTKAVEYWKIRVENNSIITEYGHVGTENPQTTVDMIKEGKNVGKRNETTPVQQAQAEAQASWTKKVKKGYVESIDDANQKKVNTEVIKGGVEPMLAQKYSEQGDKIKYPAYIQPKLDGHRAVAVIDKGKASIWSRTRKPINSVPHIIKALEDLSPNKSLILDGEIYNHELRDNFEKITTIVNQKTKPDEDYKMAQYHIYDVVNNDPYHLRLAFLSSLKLKPPLILVHTEVVKDEVELYAFFDKCLKKGYEGAMVRNSDGKYIHSRSYDLQKIKEFDDDEFEIVGVQEGNGKLSGHVGAFLVKTKEGVVFGAKMDGDTKKLKEYFENHDLWKGKKLNVRYQGFTKKNHVPRFPVGRYIREE